MGDPAADLSRDDRDSAASLPKAVVIDPSFDWEADQPPRIAWHRSVLYAKVAEVAGHDGAQIPAQPSSCPGTHAPD